jgi:hypothetical protein
MSTPAAAPVATSFAAPLTVLRRHWLILVLLAAGLALRAATQLAYHPALLYIDTLKYLYGSWPGADPLGYRLILQNILQAGDLGTVAALQHVLGLAMAVVLYAVLARRGAARWLAALAVAPVLLDAYQLQMEQTIMPDVWFEAMIVTGLAVLLWRPAVTIPAAVMAGLVLGSCATVRQVGEVLIVPAVIFVLAAGGGRRHALVRAVALTAALALPILGYCSASAARSGHFWLSSSQGSVPGRLAAAADCATLRLPAAVRPLCPTPAQQAQGPDWLDHSRQAPLRVAVVAPGTRRSELISEFDSAVESQQPLRVLTSILRDSDRLFAVTRTATPGVTPLARWQFQTSFPTYRPEITVGARQVIIVGLKASSSAPFRYETLGPSYGGAAQVDRPLATFLRSYQLDGGYAPGPLLAICALGGLGGSVLALRRRRGGPRGQTDDSRRPAEDPCDPADDPRGRRRALACLLLFGAGLAVLLAADVFEFSWRYQLPALVTLPPAGVLGIGLILDRGAERLRRRPRGGPRGRRPHRGGSGQSGPVPSRIAPGPGSG